MESFSREISNKTAALALMAVSCLVYANSLFNGFVQDDLIFIVHNDFIKSWKHIPDIFTAAYLTAGQDFTPGRIFGSGEINYRPIATLSYFLDYGVWGLKPAGYHLTNLLLHLANVLLLFQLARRILVKKWTAFLAALFFAVHPVNAETVNNIAFRKDLFVFLFYISALLLYIKGEHARPLPGFFYRAASLVLFFLSIFSKEMAVTLPLVLMLYDYFFTCAQDARSFLKQFVKRYGGYFAVLLISLAVFFSIQRNLSGFIFPYRGGSFYTNFLVELHAFFAYVRWLFWPVDIHVALREPTLVLPPYSILNPQTLMALGTLVLCLTLVLVFQKKNKVISFSVLWFLITLIPVSNIIPMPTILACHFLYLPMAGFAIFLAQSLASLAALKSPLVSELFFEKSARIVCAVFIGMCFLLTLQRNSIWKNDLSLWAECARIYPKSAEAHKGFADELKKEDGFWDLAIREYKTAIQLDPKSPDAYNELGIAYMEKKSYPLALEYSKKALERDPSFLPAYHNLVLCYFNLNRWEDAKETCRKMITVNPASPTAYQLLGVLEGERQNGDQAIAYLQKALSLDPYDIETLINLGILYAQKKEWRLAEQAWKEVLRLKPSNMKAKANLDHLAEVERKG